jgi:transcriptional regulator with XRE-family HTH domain
MADTQGTPSARARQLARELRELREAAGLRGNVVARRLGWSASKLSRIENGRIGIAARDLERLVELYQISDERADRLRALVPQLAAKGWWDAYADGVHSGYAQLLKAEADSWAVQCYCAVVPHALLQTVDYSRAVILAGARPPTSQDLDRRLDIVRRRQGPLDASAAAARGREPVQLSAVLDESVVLRLTASSRTPGDDGVSAGQIRHLISLTAHPQVEIRLLSLAVGPPPISSGSFSLLTPLADTTPDVVCFENKSRAFFIDEEHEVHSYVQDFERIGVMALSPADSLKRLKAALAACRAGSGA